MMSSNTKQEADTHTSGDIAAATTATKAQDLIPGLPDHFVVTYILRSENLADPIDLARIRAVSRGMCEVVEAKGRSLRELDAQEAMRLGCLRTLKHLHRQGRLGHLHNNHFYCGYTACYGQLEVLKWFRANGCTWDAGTCAGAAHGGHLKMFQWARANGCPWDEFTCKSAARDGQLETLQWLRANGCPWEEQTRRIAATLGYVEYD